MTRPMSRVKINIDPTDKILLKRNLNKNGKAQKFLTSEVKRLSDSYVPFRQGNLKREVRLEPNKITYTQPYAKQQYYENKGLGKDGISKGGMRGKQWVSRMWSDRGKEIVKSVADFVGGKAK